MSDDLDRTDPGGHVEEKTVLFADVVDSTKLYDDKGDEVAHRLIVQCLDLMAEIVEASDGVVEDRIGDEILVTFDDPEKAAHAASQLQQRVTNGHSEGELDTPMRIRVGLEHGPITRTERGLFGTTIHAAARVVGLAKASQILTPKRTLAMLGPIRQRMERYFATIVLKGIASETDIHELLWDTSATVVTMTGNRRKRPMGMLGVNLLYGDEDVTVDASKPRITLGRDEACTIQLDGSAVSRLHARIMWNRGKISLEDVSTNGTCIEGDDGSSRVIHHDRVELTGSGVLRCGCLGAEEDAALVQFDCKAAEEE